MTRWPTVPLGEAAEIRGGATPRRQTAAYWSGGIPWLTPTELPPTRGGIADVRETAESITEQGLASISASILPPGTVLFSSRATIGKVGVAKVPLATNQGFANFIPRHGVVESRYLAWCLLFHADQISRLAGSTTFKEVTKKSLSVFRIPLPSLSEQRHIVKIIDLADYPRQICSDADSKSHRILSALFRNSCTRANPQSPLERLDKLVEIGGTLVDPNQPELLELPHIGGAQIEKSTGRILEPPSVRESRLHSGKFHFTAQHVLYSKIRPNLNKVVFPGFPGLCSADIYPLLPTDRRLGPWFLTALLRSDEFLVYASAQSDPLRIPKLNREQLGSYPVRLPEPQVLQAFESHAEHLARLDARRCRLRVRIDALFETLLHHAFSGSLATAWHDDKTQELAQEVEGQGSALADPTL